MMQTEFPSKILIVPPELDLQFLESGQGISTWVLCFEQGVAKIVLIIPGFPDDRFLYVNDSCQS